ncbi:unnamed protein product, partial [Amoebophrya sp. A25]
KLCTYLLFRRKVYSFEEGPPAQAAPHVRERFRGFASFPNLAGKRTGPTTESPSVSARVSNS